MNRLFEWLKRLLEWPKKPGNDYASWNVIFRRAILVFPILFAAWSLWLLHFICGDSYEANKICDCYPIESINGYIMNSLLIILAISLTIFVESYFW